MTCLTLTPASVAEAADRRADLVVVHHPLPFRPLSRITCDTTVGRLLWELSGSRIAVYSAHTAFDSAEGGINHSLAVAIGLQQIEPLVPCPSGTPGTSGLGSGRCGILVPAETVGAIGNRLKAFLKIPKLWLVGEVDLPVSRAGLGCGSGGSLLEAARNNGCQCFITGEANFHACLEAQAADVVLILVGHFASERFAMEMLAERLSTHLDGVEVWPSERENCPLREL
jgi:dinuclear metal center YbgI/SA1388 family protein